MAIGGIGSGLDTRSLIEQLVQFERQPIQRLERRRADVQATISDVGRFSQALRRVTSLATELGSSTSGGLRRVASSAVPSVLGVRATPLAESGTYDVEILGRARAAQAASAVFSSANDPAAAEVRAGTLTIEASGETPVVVALDPGSTLASVAESINASSTSIVARVVDTGSGFRLAIAAKREGFEPGTGAENALVVTENSTGSTGAALGVTTTVEARNARVRALGVEIERRSNTITDVIPGLTLELLGEQEGTVSVQVQPDTQGVVEKLEEMVRAYNNVVQSIRTRESLPSVTRQAMDELRRVFTSFSIEQDGPRSLADIGVTTNKDTGLLEVNRTLLGDVLSNASSAVVNLFAQPSVGLASRAFALEQQYTNSVTGILPSAVKGMKFRTDSIATSIERREAALVRYRASLQRQFTALENVMSRMQTADNAITSFIPILGADRSAR